MEVGDHLYTLEHPVGGIDDLLAWDMGFGLNHPDFQDIVIPNNAPIPVNFNVPVDVVGQINELGFGQAEAPQIIVLDVEENEPQLGDGGVQEAAHHGNLSAVEPPFDDID